MPLSAPAHPAPLLRPPPIRQLGSAACAAVLLCLTFSLLPQPLSAQEPPGGAQPTVVQAITKLPEHNFHLYDFPAWSHDGRKIAFMVHDMKANNTSTIWIFHPDSGRLEQVTRADSVGMIDAQPVWSPDDRQIAFASNRGGAINVFTVDADGRNLRQRTRDLEDAFVWRARPSWSPQGDNLVFSTEVEGNSDLYRLDLSTDATTRLTTDPGVDETPRWAPDGSRILFISDRSGTPALHFMDPASGEIEAFVTELGRPGWGHRWSPDGNWIALVESGYIRDWSCSLVSVATGKVYPLPAPAPAGRPHTTFQPSWNPDGRSILFTAMPRRLFDSRLQVIDLATKEIQTLQDSLLHLGRSSWSPQGRQLVFSSVPKEGDNPALLDTLLSLMPAQPAAPVSILGAGKEPHWSPQGAQIAFITTGPGAGTLALYGLEDKRTELLESGQPGQVRALRFSPDGELLAYIRETAAAQELWVYDLVSQDHFQLTYSGGAKSAIRWSPDGEHIVFVHRKEGQDDAALWLVPAYGGKNRRLTAAGSPAADPLWPQGPEGPLYFASQRGEQWEIWTTGLQGGEAFLWRSSHHAFPVLKRGDEFVYLWGKRHSDTSWSRELAVFNQASSTDEILTQTGNLTYLAPAPAGDRIAFRDIIGHEWEKGDVWQCRVDDILAESKLP